MRTKTLICAAALAAGVVSSMAQSNVYSLNVVGYVNVVTKGDVSFNMIGNPMNNTASNGNGITNLFKTASDGDQIYTWDTGTQDLGATVYTYSGGAHTWDGNFFLKPGQGIFYLDTGSGNHTNTFVGDVMQGTFTNAVPVVGNVAFNMIASSVPIGGPFTNAIVGLVNFDGDQVYTWDVNTGDLGSTIATYSGGAHAWDNPTIPITPGIGFFYLATGPTNQAWTRSFTVQ